MGLGPMEVIGILVLALVVFGPKRLPEMGKSIGKAIREFKSVGNEIQDEITKVTDDIDMDPDNNIKPPDNNIKPPDKDIKPPKST